MSRSRFGWNSDRGMQERSFRWLRKRLKEDSILLLMNPDAYLCKYPNGVSPVVVVIQEMIQKYIDFDGEKLDSLAVEGPLDRYCVKAVSGRGTTLRVAILDKERLSEYLVRNQSTREEFPFILHYGCPCVELGEGKVRHSLDFFLDKPTEWKLGGPGVIFEGPVVEVIF